MFLYWERLSRLSIVEQVLAQTVGLRELVANPWAGDTIEIETSGYTAADKSITHQVVVKSSQPGKPIFKTVSATTRIVQTINEVLRKLFEGKYEFKKGGPTDLCSKCGDRTARWVERL